MKKLLLPHLYQGQCLSYYWMHITAANPASYPHDHGYEVFYKNTSLGKVLVAERRTIKVSALTEWIAKMICGYKKPILIKDLQQRGIPCNDESLVYLFQFKWDIYHEAYDKYWREVHEVNLAKNRHNQRNFQYNLI